MKAKGPGWRYEKVNVPIYDLRLHLAVCKDPKALSAARLELSDVFGREVDEDRAEYDGLTSYHSRDFGIFLATNDLSHGLVAHEIFHATLRMMEFIGSGPTRQSHEPSAYLLAWITDWVYRFLPKR